MPDPLREHPSRTRVAGADDQQLDGRPVVGRVCIQFEDADVVVPRLDRGDDGTAESSIVEGAEGVERERDRNDGNDG